MNIFNNEKTEWINANYLNYKKKQGYYGKKMTHDFNVKFKCNICVSQLTNKVKDMKRNKSSLNLSSVKIRACLRCCRKFHSEWSGNRLCDYCKNVLQINEYSLKNNAN